MPIPGCTPPPWKIIELGDECRCSNRLAIESSSGHVIHDPGYDVRPESREDRSCDDANTRASAAVHQLYDELEKVTKKMEDERDNGRHANDEVITGRLIANARAALAAARGETT